MKPQERVTVTDIVQRLRQYGTTDRPEVPDTDSFSLLYEAADEIERLQKIAETARWLLDELTTPPAYVHDLYGLEAAHQLRARLNEANIKSPFEAVQAWEK